jgi:uncharacterized membrane protein YedE/YeeE
VITEFTPFASFFGGTLIGLAAVLLMALHGRIAGITGILSGLIPPVAPGWSWRLAFLVGTVAAPALIISLGADAIPFQSEAPTSWLVIGGLIVGIGVHFGAGCPSGHGVCGIARLSRRSITATLVFMASTAMTVFVIRHLIGGLS